ncbi:hypothetical protein JKP88DRAFT_301476 [Tribonema minus]|uniref:Uncharacterized protein n=1 Tax=Tribonema minus TaxID=303371 RepID=A0A835Z9I2_9STRA|nr:hypothetical protein JKP88DRAFT_301476 [Tribonema minus]
MGLAAAAFIAGGMVQHQRVLLAFVQLTDRDVTDDLKAQAEAALQEAARLRAEAEALEDRSPEAIALRAEQEAVIAAAGRARSEPVSRGDGGSLKEDLVGTRYVLSFDIGREKGTWMPPQWGASGARLNVDVLVEFGPSGTFAEVALKSPFVATDVAGIAWSVEGARGTGSLQQSTLRFSLQTSGAARGDVSIPAGPIYCSVPAWGARLSRSRGMVTVRQKRWGIREESRILGVFSAQRVE